MQDDIRRTASLLSKPTPRNRLWTQAFRSCCLTALNAWRLPSAPGPAGTAMLKPRFDPGRVLPGAIFGVCLVLSHAVVAEPTSIIWEDLLPPSVPGLEREVDGINTSLESQSPALKRKMRRIMYDLMDRDSTAAEGTNIAVTDTERDVIREAVGNADFPTAIEFWTMVKSVRARLRAAENEVDPSLDGKTIRMPGYLLPLEFDGDAVTEFLLVPYVGACIHVPPPPPNQMVFVTSSIKVEVDELYAPIWIEGTLRAQSGTYSLNLTDGEAPVEAGYTLDAVKVEAY